MRPRANHGSVPPAGLLVSAAPGGTEAVAASRFAAVWWASAAPTWWHQLRILGRGDEVVEAGNAMYREPVMVMWVWSAPQTVMATFPRVWPSPM